MAKYDWGDGKGAVHTIPLQRHQAHVTARRSGQTNMPAAANLPGTQAPPSTGVGVAPPPFDAGLEARRAAGEKRRATILGDLNTDVTEQAQKYGFKYDPVTGKFGGFDPTNPFSMAALLKKTRDESTKASEMTFSRNVRGNQINFGNAGQIYSGAFQNAQ